LSSPCVLIVDDDEASLCQMSETVEGLGFAIRTATSGQGALDCLRGGNVDVLLLDLVMPDIDGLAVLEAMARAGASVPAIVAVARPDPALLASAANAGAMDFVEKPATAERLRFAIDMAGLTGQEDSLVATLAGGWKQRLALGAAILHNPQILFLDEPTSGVDPLTRREFWGFINAVVARGVTVMVTTHFMDEAEYCDRVALIYRGQVIALDTPEALQARVKTAELPNPTLEDAFIGLIEVHDRARAA